MSDPKPKLTSSGYALRLGMGRETKKYMPPLEPMVPGTVALVVVRLGPFHLAIEASRVIEVRAGAVYMGAQSDERPVIAVDLHEQLRVPSSESQETLVARGDGKLGRGDGLRVAFAVDDCDRLVTAPLEAFSPLPPVAKEQIQVDFIAGVVKVVLRNDDKTVEKTAFLLDPEKLAQAGSAARG
jgi:hypothetical protein